jgi:transcription elongation factor SPT6
LTVTWKVTDNIYQHIDIRETGKENAFSLGQSLWIGKNLVKCKGCFINKVKLAENLEFEDLDEIIARHINPMAAFARDVLGFKYYRDFDGGKKEKAEQFLLEERDKNKNKIHYFLSASKVIQITLNNCS